MSRLILVVVVSVPLVGCGSTADRVPGSSTTGASTATVDVVVIGDSITEQGRPVIEQRIGALRRVIVDGRSGFRVDQQLSTAQRLAAVQPDQVIIELGTNDVLQGWDLDRSADGLRQVVDLFGSSRCIHLVMIDENMPSADGESRERARRLNAAMADIASSDGRVHLIDVPSLVERFETVDPGEPYALDGVHPTEAGQSTLVDAYVDALDRCDASAAQVPRPAEDPRARVRPSVGGRRSPGSTPAGS